MNVVARRMSDRQIVLATADEVSAAEYLRFHGIIVPESECPCGRQRVIVLKNNSAVWRCNAGTCRSRSTVSVRLGSEFLSWESNRNRLPLHKIIDIINLVIDEICARRVAIKAEVDKSTACKWMVGELVQIDESLFGGKGKYKRGQYGAGDLRDPARRQQLPDDDDAPDDAAPAGARNYGNLDRHPLWVFGLCWWHGSGVPNEVRFIHVEDRTAATLIPLIQHHLKPGTLIFSDEWRAYSRINQHGYEHHTVNHQEHYVHPVTQVNTQAIESHWERPKRRILKMCKGVGKDNLKYYLAEYWWRTCQMTRPGEQSKCLFELFLKAVASAYPLQ